MNLTDEEILELHDLLNGLVERNLPPIKLKRLENWILESPIVRREYVSFMDMSSSLSHYAEEIVSDEDEISDEDCEQENKTIKFFRPFLGIAALFILSLTLFNFMSHNFSEQDLSLIHI